MKKVIYFIAICLVATSCSVFGKYSRPQVVTDNIYGVDVKSTDSTTIADIDWRTFFTDKHLQKLIEQGLENNADMQSAAQRIIAAEATYKTARLAFIPGFNFNPSYTLNSGKSSLSLPINASWEVDITGRILNSKRSAKAAYEQSRLYRQSVQTALVTSIANYYYTLLMLDAQLEVSRSTADSWRENVRIMKAMKLAGMTNEASVSQTEANSCSINASLFDLEYDITRIENALALLLGTTPQHFERGSIYEQKLNSKLAVGIPAQLLAYRPDVRSAEKQLEQAFYATNSARGAFIPKLTLSGQIGLAIPTDLITSLTAALATPIFNAGSNHARLKIAKAEQEQALIAFKHTLLKAGNEVNDALAKCQAAIGKRDIRKQQIAALESAVNSTQQLMRHSESTYLEVLTAQQKLLSAQLSQITDKFDEIQGIIELYRALGGGIDHNEDISALPKRRRK
ncbi:MAG: efflux transporter outer membrane subunit [Alistipes sp.]|nr:efflux transporter outer membrane subunit [Alistipes sp.]